jgi:hypothetical protein
MRAFHLLAVFVILGLTAGCASRDAVGAHQIPGPYYGAGVHVPTTSPYSRQMALGAVTGTSQFSWFLPEPNRSVFRPRFQAALESAGLAAPDPAAARYIVSFHFTDIDGPAIGSHMDAEMIGRVTVVDRARGIRIFDEPVAAYREAYWPGIFEDDWRTLAPLHVLSIFPFFFDSPWLSVGPRSDTVYPPYSAPEWVPLVPIRLRESDGVLVRSDTGRVYGARSGAERAWQVNAAVSDALTAAFLRGFADAGHIEVARVIPCTGGADLRALELELMRRGETFITRPCDTEFGVRRTNAGGW